MRPTAEQIDALLPQTQCGLCNFKGCIPYATALADNTAEINLCPPGGVEGLVSLANLLEKDPTPYMAEMAEKAKPSRVVSIREAECIGCTKCIQACPVDAILGMAKQMHTVIATECTGCELCIAPCPVDCIDLVDIPAKAPLEQANQYRNRYRAREKRLQQQTTAASQVQTAGLIDEKQSYIQAALLRVQAKQQK